MKNGPLREEIEANGIKLIYIDPPFDVGADFTMDVEIGEEILWKEPNVLEEIAYRDTWAKVRPFLSMLYERLILAKDLLSEDGSIYLHCDWRVSGRIRLLMDEIFGEGGAVEKQGFRNEIIWKSTSAHSDSGRFGNIHQTIFFYSKSYNPRWNEPFGEYDEEYVQTYFRYKDDNGRRFRSGDLSAAGKGWWLQV